MTDATDDSGIEPSLNFIADNVAEEDAFNSHSRIATAVAGVIRQKKDLKVIGLLGSWGSGKSTVVGFIQKILRADHRPVRFHCFTYDAWLHQSDPPRRAFLENLIRFLIEEDLTKDVRWDDKIKQLNRQIEDTETTSTPTLSCSGRFLLFTSFFVPVGMNFISHDWFDAASKDKANLLDWIPFVTGWILLFLPILTAFGFYLWWRPWKDFRKKGFWTNHRAPYQRESILSLFTNREVVHQKNRTIRTPEPTTIEFQETFREIMEAVSAKDRRFIFIVDNLDRLPESQAVELWATIRSFFLGADQRLNLPTVILPIDEKSVKRMYAASHPGADTALELAQSFMDKTFDLKFHVSRPVLSDWNQYLEEQMVALFGQNLKQEWLHQVRVILDGWLVSAERESDVTPRFINTLLNSIGTLWLQWHNSAISFASIAHYAVHRNTIGSDILTEVQKENVWLAEEDPFWQTSLAALHYGVEPDRAAQVLLERPLMEAIQRGTEADFLKSAAVPGFTTVFERILDRANDSGLAFSATNAIRLYNAHDLPADAVSMDAWRRLRTLYSNRSTSGEITRADVDALETLIARCPAADMSQFLITAARRMSTIKEGAFSKAEDVANWVQASRTLSCKARELGSTELKFTMQGAPKFYLKALTLVSEDEALLKSVGSNASAERIIESLAEMVEESATNPGADTCVRFLKLNGLDANWAPVAKAAGANLLSSVDDGTAISANCLSYLFSSDVNANIQVRQLAESGNLRNRLHEALNGNNNLAIASISALLLVSRQAEFLTTPDGSTWEAALGSRRGLAEQIGRQLSAFGEAKDFRFYIDFSEQHPALAPLIKAIASSRFREGELELPTPADAARDFASYTSCLNDDLRVQFASRVGGSPDFWTELASLDLDDNELTYLALLDQACTHRVQAANATKEKLRLVSAEQWGAAISSGLEPYGLALALAKADATADLDGNLFDALHQSIPTLCSIGEAAHIERWFELNAALDADLSKTLLLGVRDELTAKATGTDLVPLLSAQGNALLREGEFGDRADGAARNVIIPLLVSTDLSFLFDHSEAFIPVLEGCKPGSRDAIGTQLGAKWEAAETQEAKDRFDRLRGTWGLPKFAAQANDDVDGG